MSSSELAKKSEWFGRAPIAVAAVLGLSLVLNGCGGFQPLYGTNASGQSFQEVMASVSIPTIPGRVGQQVRNELIFKTTGGGEAATPAYLLEIALKETAQSELVKRLPGRLAIVESWRVRFRPN